MRPRELLELLCACALGGALALLAPRPAGAPGTAAPPCPILLGRMAHA